MQIEEETDVYWKRESRESHDQIRERGRKFIQWLMARPEQRLAVVSHSSFMYFMLSNYGHDASETVQSGDQAMVILLFPPDIQSFSFSHRYQKLASLRGWTCQESLYIPALSFWNSESSRI